MIRAVRMARFFAKGFGVGEGWGVLIRARWLIIVVRRGFYGEPMSCVGSVAEWYRG